MRKDITMLVKDIHLDFVYFESTTKLKKERKRKMPKDEHKKVQMKQTNVRNK